VAVLLIKKPLEKITSALGTTKFPHPAQDTATVIPLVHISLTQELTTIKVGIRYPGCSAINNTDVILIKVATLAARRVANTQTLSQSPAGR
jgi:hypothetical protein